MKAFRSIILLLLFFFPGLSAQDSETIDWDYEIDLLGRELTEKHPDLFFNTDSAWFFREMKQVAAVAPNKSLFQVAVMLQQLMAGLGDAQTQINYHFLVDKSKILPFSCYWFEDGLYVLETDRLYEGLLGNKLSSINGTSLEVVVDSLATLLIDGNSSVIKNHIPRMLSWFQLLEYFGFASGQELALEVSTPSGSRKEIVMHLPVELGEMLQVGPIDLPLGWQDQNTFFWDQYNEDEGLYFIQYNRCWSREAEEDYGSGASALFMPSFKEFEKEVYPVLRKKKIDKLIFDMRFNRGGHPLQGTDFIRKICRTLPRDHGDVFVLVGRTTSSAAIINTVDFMNCTEVVLVGEETGGKPNHFGDIKRFVLPESRLIVSHPTRYFKLLKEDLPGLEPDLAAGISFEQYLHGVDPAVEAVRSYIQP